MSIPQRINCDDISKKIWCGTIEKLNHNLEKHSVTLFINVNDSGIEKKYIVNFLQVLEFKITYEHPEEDWDYVELTEVSLKQRDDVYELTCDLWSSGGLFMICKYIEFVEE